MCELGDDACAVVADAAVRSEQRAVKIGNQQMFHFEAGSEQRYFGAGVFDFFRGKSRQ